VEQLRAFEDMSVMPLLNELGAGAVRDTDFQLVLTPGSIAFLVNNADAYCEDECGSVVWQPLSVLYCDASDYKGEVFRLRARRTPKTVSIVESEICGCCQSVVVGDKVEMCSPFDGRRLLSVRTDDPAGVVLNSWYVFRGAVLPLLYHNEYAFMHVQPDRVRFQAQLLHQIRVAYQGVM
jgi:hypothetical protein